VTKPRYRDVCIEIRDSISFSIGEPAALWVSGKDRWFEIDPSPRFRPIYNEAIEAIDLYYKVLTVYEEYFEKLKRLKKNKKAQIQPPSIDEVLFKVGHV
jgi:RPA family protein